MENLKPNQDMMEVNDEENQCFEDEEEEKEEEEEQNEGYEWREEEIRGGCESQGYVEEEEKVGERE